MNYCVTCHEHLTDKATFVNHFDHKLVFGGEVPVAMVYNDSGTVALYDAVYGTFIGTFDDDRHAEEHVKLSFGKEAVVEIFHFGEFQEIQMKRMAA